MNATTLDINLSQTLANKTLVVTTILVSGQMGQEAIGRRALILGLPETVSQPIITPQGREESLS